MQLLLQKESDSVEYYEMMLSQNENQSILIHDIKKHLQSIKLLNEQKASDKINAYIQQLMESSDLKETVKICDNAVESAKNIPDSFIELTVQKKGKFTFYHYHSHKFL